MRSLLERFRAAVAMPAVLAAFAAFAAIAGTTTAQAAEELWALSTNNNLYNFSSTSPGTLSLRPITGLMPGETALAIDFRPAMPVGRLYVLGSTNRVYLIADPNSGVATPVGGAPFATALAGLEFGFDFNPTVDRIRIVSDADQNLRAQPDLGTIAAVDSMLAFNVGDPNFGTNPRVTGAAYTNSFAGATTTVLYDIDSNLDVLATQLPPNNGKLNTVGSLGVDATDDNGFDISGATGVAYAVFGWGPTTAALYTINLSTGGATLVGPVGCNERLRGLSVGREFPTPTLDSSWGKIKDTYR